MPTYATTIFMQYGLVPYYVASLELLRLSNQHPSALQPYANLLYNLLYKLLQQLKKAAAHHLYICYCSLTPCVAAGAGAGAAALAGSLLAPLLLFPSLSSVFTCSTATQGHASVSFPDQCCRACITAKKHHAPLTSCHLAPENSESPIIFIVPHCTLLLRAPSA